MPNARTSVRSAQRALRRKMRDEGMSYGQIAVEFARLYQLRSRAAWRHAHGWSLTEAAERINSYAATSGLGNKATVSMTAAHLCEYENWPGQAREPAGRRPTPYLLSLLAVVYGCTAHDLLDGSDYEHMRPADLLVLDKATDSNVQLTAGGAAMWPGISRAQPAAQSFARGRFGVPEASRPGDLAASVSNPRGRWRPAASLERDTWQVLDVSDVCDSRIPRLGDVQNLDERTLLRLRELPGSELEELYGHLADQWHALVKTDNLLGPRYALGAVLTQLAVIEALLRATRWPARQGVLCLAARYAESAAWLHEDSGDLNAARYWTGRAMEWAVEGDDRLMLSWVLFRRSQQAMASRDAAQVASLSSAARREAGGLKGPALAAILQQQAHARALDGAEAECHRLLDSAHDQAATPDDPGDASSGHGSFCTPAYLEMQRGVCWLTLGRPAQAVAVLEEAVESLPAVYRRDRGLAFGSQAIALAAMGEPAEAAKAGMSALEIARDAGSRRILRGIMPLSAALAPHNELEHVAVFQAALADSWAD